MEITLKDGFTVLVNRDALDDWEVFDAICSLSGDGNQNIAAIPTVFRAILGADGLKAVKEHFRETTGKCRASDMIAALGEILSGFNGTEKK